MNVKELLWEVRVIEEEIEEQFAQGFGFSPLLYEREREKME